MIRVHSTKMSQFFNKTTHLDCIPAVTIHVSSSPGLGPGFDDLSTILVESCDLVVDGIANYFLAPGKTYDTAIVFDLECVVHVSKIKIKNTRNANADE